MPIRYYANAPATTLAVSCTSGATSIQVTSTAGLPIQYPFTLIIDRGLPTEEAVSCTNAVSTTLTVTRGIDGTTAFAHTGGAEVVHGITAQDIREPNSHVNASSAVHGLTGAVVGTTDTQTLTNKTISVDNNTVSGLAASSFALTNASGNLDGAASAKAIPAGTVVGTNDAQTLTNKTISADNNTLSGIAASSFVLSNGSGNIDGAAAQKAIPAGAVVGTTDTQTLTNKNLTSSTNTFPYTAPDVQVFTSSGTWNKPAGAKTVRIRVVGGGGAGGGAAATGASQASAGASGGGGAYAEAILPASSVGSSETVTIGAAGIGQGGAAGTAGGDSSFGTLLTAGGGLAGAFSGASGSIIFVAGGLGGTPGGSAIQVGLRGQPGGASLTGGAAGIVYMSGPGGGSHLGHGGAQSVNGNGNAPAASSWGWGGGGGGCSQHQSQGSARTGGDGKSGVVIVETFFS